MKRNCLLRFLIFLAGTLILGHKACHDDARVHWKNRQESNLLSKQGGDGGDSQNIIFMHN